MFFNSPEFLIFWVVLLGVLAPVGSNDRYKALLLVASYLFCAWASPAFLVPLALSILATFETGRRMAAEPDPQRRKIWLVASIAVNLGLLAWFKYTGFLSENMLGALHALGFDTALEPLRMALPIGISFYTIQAIGYSIDVYRRPTRATQSLLDLALFLAFFPRLVAGPILRSAAFLPQLATRRPIGLDNETLFLFLGGLVKKSLVADNLAPFVDGIFSNPGHWPTPVIWLGVVAFTIQAYCDFSGYTDMAIAVARVLGYRLPPNFDYPFFARNPPDFWRRWHISFSNWVREYVFTSLPGGQDSKLARWRNTLVTMFVFGLWHGAAWTFVAWGVAHGLLLVAYDAYGTLRKRLDPGYRPATGTIATTLSILAMQLCVLVIMIPFRAPNLASAWLIFRSLFPGSAPSSFVGIGLGEIQGSRALILMFGFAVAHLIAYRSGRLEERLSRVPAPLAAVSCAALGFVAYCLWPMDEPPFIYVRF